MKLRQIKGVTRYSRSNLQHWTADRQYRQPIYGHSEREKKSIKSQMEIYQHPFQLDFFSVLYFFLSFFYRVFVSVYKRNIFCYSSFFRFLVLPERFGLFFFLHIFVFTTLYTYTDRSMRLVLSLACSFLAEIQRMYSSCD